MYDPELNIVAELTQPFYRLADWSAFEADLRRVATTRPQKLEIVLRWDAYGRDWVRRPNGEPRMVVRSYVVKDGWVLGAQKSYMGGVSHTWDQLDLVLALVRTRAEQAASEKETFAEALADCRRRTT